MKEKNGRSCDTDFPQYDRVEATFPERIPDFLSCAPDRAPGVPILDPEDEKEPDFCRRKKTGVKSRKIWLSG